MDPPFAVDKPALEWEAEWKDRARTTVAVTADQTIGDVLDRAADDLGVRVTADVVRGHPVSALIDSIVFDAGDGTPGPRLGWLTIVSDDGALRWWQRFSKVAIADLERTRDAGLLDGDLTRWYLLPQPPGSGFPGAGEWQFFVHGLSAAWNVVKDVGPAAWDAFKDLGPAATSAGILANYAHRLYKGRRAIEEKQAAWEERGAIPADIAGLLARRPWAQDRLAVLLGTTPEQAAAILAMFGYQPGSDGTWAPGADAESQLLAGTLQIILLDRLNVFAGKEPLSGEPPDAVANERLEQVLQEMRESFETAGEVPEPPTAKELFERPWEPPS